MSAPTPERWDVVVVGAGPAGSAAALGALAERPGSRVLLLDRADFPRDKCCGDGIAPHVLDLLAPVGAGDVAEGWDPLRRLTLASGASSVEGALSRPVWVIPREVFDARLVERAVAAGAVLRRHRVRRVDRRDGEVVLDGRYAAPVVVGADGAHSAVRDAVAPGAAAEGGSALAIRGYVPTPDHLRGVQVIRFGDRRQPSYAWSFDRGDGWANVGYGEFLQDDDSLSRAVMLEELDRLLPGTVAPGERWRAHHLPLSGRRWPHPDGPVLLAGDAAGLVNPMTGEGIFYAVLTGVAAGRTAARAVAEGAAASAGASYRRRVRRDLARHLRHTWLAARLVRSDTVLQAGIRVSARDRRVFDDLVELGLGGGTITPRVAGRLVSGLGVLGVRKARGRVPTRKTPA
jgi:menaquinone-9 beta-reductase